MNNSPLPRTQPAFVRSTRAGRVASLRSRWAANASRARMSGAPGSAISICTMPKLTKAQSVLENHDPVLPRSRRQSVRHAHKSQGSVHGEEPASFSMRDGIRLPRSAHRASPSRRSLPRPQTARSNKPAHDRKGPGDGLTSAVSPRITGTICCRSASAVSPSARRPFRTSPWRPRAPAASV